MQKGFIFNSLYIALGSLAVITLVSGYAYIQTKRLEAANAKLEAIHALGVEAEKKKVAQEAKDKLNKEKADNELKKLRSVNADLSKRLRDNAGSSFVPRTEASTGKPDLACFDTDALDGAIKRFAERVTGITEQGQSAVTELDNAKRWAQGNQ